MEILGLGYGKLVLGVWDPWGAEWGAWGSAWGPGVSRESVSVPQEGRESWASWKAPSRLGVGAGQEGPLVGSWVS